MRMMKKIYVVICLLSVIALTANAQFTETHVSDDAYYLQGMDLYQQGQYQAAKEMLERYLEQDAKSLRYEDEAVYYIAATRFELREKNTDKILQQYIKQHPYSAYRSDVYFMSGVYGVEKRKFPAACKDFSKVNADELTEERADQYYFCYGYALLEQAIKSIANDDSKDKKNKSGKSSSTKSSTKSSKTSSKSSASKSSSKSGSKSSGKSTTASDAKRSARAELGKAIEFFNRLRGKRNPYTLQAQYYYAYCQYLEQEYGKALQAFLRIENTEEYEEIVPYYIIQIYYMRSEYGEVISRAEKLIANNPENPNNTEIHRILGEIYYNSGDYTRAARNLAVYQMEERKPLRADVYELGMSYYKTGEYEKAIAALQKVTSQQDEMTENAYLHIGNSYVKLGDKANARMAFGAASKTDFDPVIHEEAKFNYALSTYESATAFGESVNAFTDFINEYPNSVHTPQAYEILTDVFLTSKNYKAAMKALNNLSNPTPKLQETKTFLLYQIAIDAYNHNHLKEAIDTFTSVIECETANAPVYRTESYFWRAESQYKLRHYDNAAEDLNTFFSQPNAQMSENYVSAFYSAGYAWFAQKDYVQARNYFMRYISAANQKDPTYPDALNRIGDCYFSQREFVSAEKYYAQVIGTGDSGADYAMFQRGYALGLLKRHNDKIIALEKLVKNYPKSEFADDALYEIARANQSKNDAAGAIRAYDDLMNLYPRSPLARKAALEKGMTYANAADYANAINAYKQVIDKYPKTEEAYSALDGLEAAYMENGNVREFSEYTKNLSKKGMKVTVVKEDSLTYVAAERQYMFGNYDQAIQGFSSYIKENCDGGRYCSMARYYLADSYYRTDRKSEALKYYAALTQSDSNPYIEEACIRAAEIAYDEKKYKEAIVYFKKLQDVANTTEKLNIARLGVLRCSNYLGDSRESVQIASEILNDAKSSDDVKIEARYNRMKAYIDLGRIDEAAQDMKAVAQDMNSEQGAEAKYLLAKYYYDGKQYEWSEREIVEFAGSNTEQQYWLAKSFVLLADINMQRGDYFQAKQYLLSLQSNYKIQDEIQDEISERLETIEKKQQEEVKASGLL